MILCGGSCVRCIGVKYKRFGFVFYTECAGYCILFSTVFSPLVGAHQVDRAKNFSLLHPSEFRLPFWLFWAVLRETFAQFGDFAGRLYSAVYSPRNNRSDLLHSACTSLGWPILFIGSFRVKIIRIMINTMNPNVSLYIYIYICLFFIYCIAIMCPMCLFCIKWPCFA